MGNVTVKYYSDAACTDEVENPKNVGTYYVGITVTEGDNYDAITSVLHDENWKFTIGKASATVTETPTAKTLTYNGSAQELVTAGKATGGTLMYRLGTDGKWQQDIPEATDAGTYKIYYYIKGDDNHKDDGSEKEPKGSVETTIKKAAQDKPTETFATTEASDDKTADGKISGLDKAKTYQYSADDGKTWTDVKAGSTEIVVKSGTYQIRYAEDKNHEAGKAASVTVTAKVAPSPEPAKTNATINLKSVTQKNNKVQVRWTKVNEADGYDVYIHYCGSKAKKAAKTIKGNSTTSVSFKKINGKKINQKKNFHVKVYAYKMVNGKKKIIAKTITAHLAGTKSVKYTNPKALKLTKSTYSIKVGKTAKIKAKVTRKNSKKKLLPKSHAAKLRYKSSNTKIATVNKNGTIKGKKKGTCYIYVYTVNGLMKKVKVTVK
ncbi:Ig-like domain-containing protein [Kandleria vitulina]|uniref:Ig-like domain-containing protein n=1 Tax=Kandleria vitulina TaxID=1630 RepID=UPI0033308815